MSKASTTSAPLTAAQARRILNATADARGRWQYRIAAVAARTIDPTITAASLQTLVPKRRGRPKAEVSEDELTQVVEAYLRAGSKRGAAAALSECGVAICETTVRKRLRLVERRRNTDPLKRRLREFERGEADLQRPTTIIDDPLLKELP